MYYNNYKNFSKARLYMATFEKLPTDNKKFRAWDDFRAMDKAVTIADKNCYGRVLRIYELNPANFKMIRAAL